VVLKTRAFFGRDFVELLVVTVDARRRGVGARLLRHAVGLSSTDRAFTSTNQSNVPMLSLLEKEGWSFSGQLEGIDEGDPELIYYKDRA
jgi:GNAT superfamily N-acetyltransferase